MEKLIKDWWQDTKKDTIEGLWFLCGIVPVAYYIFTSDERIKIILTIIDSKNIVIIGCTGLGFCILSFFVEKVMRFTPGFIWFLLTPIRLYISQKFN